MSESQDGAASPPYFDPEHFVWVAQFQVLQQPYEQIARKTKKSRQAVYNGVAAAARYLVGPRFRRWLRVSPRGRPKRSPQRTTGPS
jgi:hypothetical protein